MNNLFNHTNCRNGFLIFIFLLSGIASSGQNSFISKLDMLALNFSKSISTNDNEKIFVQINKSFYAAGEDIWLRAYCIGALSHKILRQSKSLFADIVNDKDSVINQIILNNGSFKLDGRINLPVDLPEGNYWLRAYTRRQLGDDPLEIYVQPLYVFNVDKRSNDTINYQEKISASKPLTSEFPTMQFYPEGKTFTKGNYTRVAFSAFDEEGKPMNVTGYISDSANTVIAKYSTSMTGVGSFILFGDDHAKYIAHTVYGAGKILNTELPIPDAFGYQLSVTNENDDSVFMQVSLGDSVYKKYRTSYVLGFNRNNLCYAAVGKDMYTFSIAKKNLPEGKTSILLFNDEQKVVSQRDIYISKSGAYLGIVPDKKNYGPRRKVNLSISVKNEGNEKAVIAAVLSMSINNNQKVNQDAELSVLRRMINDNIEFPEKDSDDSIRDMYSPEQWDMIMLIQKAVYMGWQNSKEKISDGFATEQSDSEVTNLTGRVFEKKNLPAKSRLVTMVFNNSGNIPETDTTDDDGRFHFKLPENIYDSAKLYFQVSTLKRNPTEDSIAIEHAHLPHFTTPLVLKKRFSGIEAKELNSLRAYETDSVVIGKGKGWLKPVTVRARKKIPVTYDESKIVSNFSRIIPGDKIGLNPNSIENALLSTAGISYGPQGIQIHGGGIGGGEPLLIVDGTQVTGDKDLVHRSADLQYLSTLNPRNIDFIEILAGGDATVYGPGSDGGVIFVHALNGGRPDLQDEKKGLKLFYVKGYCNAPVFPQPDYDKKEIKNSSYPDHRSTIYWNGNIITDSEGKATLGFFTADDPVSYNVNIIGLTAAGEILLGESKIISE